MDKYDEQKRDFLIWQIPERERELDEIIVYMNRMKQAGNMQAYALWHDKSEFKNVRLKNLKCESTGYNKTRGNNDNTFRKIHHTTTSQV